MLFDHLHLHLILQSKEWRAKGNKLGKKSKRRGLGGGKAKGRS